MKYRTAAGRVDERARISVGIERNQWVGWDGVPRQTLRPSFRAAKRIRNPERRQWWPFASTARDRTGPRSGSRVPLARPRDDGRDGSGIPILRSFAPRRPLHHFVVPLPRERARIRSALTVPPLRSGGPCEAWWRGRMAMRLSPPRGRRVCGTAPPSGLPAISPSRGEISQSPGSHPGSVGRDRRHVRRACG